MKTYDRLLITRPWTPREAKDFIQIVEIAAREQKLHVALTGSVLYGGGSGKDLDLILYCDTTGNPTRDEVEALVRRLSLEPVSWRRFTEAKEKARYPIGRIVVTAYRDVVDEPGVGQRIDFISLRGDPAALNFSEGTRQ